MAAAAWQLTAHLLSGRSASVSLRPDSDVAELRSAMAAALGLDVEGLQLFHDGADILGSGPLGRSLESLGISDGARLDVAVRSWTRPAQPPARSRLCLSAVSKARSSAFTGCFYLDIDTAASKATVEKWRKNDHDKFVYDTQLGTTTGYRQHWMTGSKEYEQPLGFSGVPLAELFDAWLGRVKPVFDDADRFWRVPVDASRDTDAEDDKLDELQLRFQALCEADDKSSRTNPRPPGKGFKAPSDDCTELLVDAQMPCFRLLRVLVGPDGMPIRAAIFTECPGHAVVEEYVVEMNDERRRRFD
mmetsp:Transcript_15996/g.32484  ORF Transcript_15996/g.32484 Transcript_15996/m.32484 type:complete len:302 (+) Transcript_15996:86-991(+)